MDNDVQRHQAPSEGRLVRWLEGFLLNILALVLAALAGAIAYSQVVYEHGLQTGAIPVATLLRGALVSVVVALVAPRTGFAIRATVFIGIYLTDLALSVATTSATVWLVGAVFEGDGNAARPWIYGGAIIPFFTGVCAYFILRRYRRSPPISPTDDRRSGT